MGNEGKTIEDVRVYLSKEVSKTRKRIDKAYGRNKPIEKNNGKMLQKS